MPRATQNSAHVTNTSVYQETTSVSQESSSSDQQWGTLQYHFNEVLDALVTVTDRSKKTLHAEMQTKFLELSNKLTLALYMVFPHQLVPAEIKNQRLQPFMPP